MTGELLSEVHPLHMDGRTRIWIAKQYQQSPAIQNMMFMQIVAAMSFACTISWLVLGLLMCLST